MTKRSLLWMTLSLALIVTDTRCRAEPGSDEAGGTPGELASSPRAREIVALVNEASDLIEAHGRAAYAAFRVKGSRWRHGDVYLFVTDMEGWVLFNAARPNREGRDLLEERDADGKPFHKDFIRIVEQFGSGWVDYMFPKPGQTVPTVKWSYVCGTRVDGTPALVGAGLYGE